MKAYLLALAARGIAPATRSSTVYALRSLYEYLRSEELVPLNPTLGMKVPVPANCARRSTPTPKPT
jgi:site-specific recombinase XerD